LIDGPAVQHQQQRRCSVTDPFEEAFWLDWFREDLSAFRMAD
jgi:hypothetical protein